jgi:hypothetical protein
LTDAGEWRVSDTNSGLPKNQVLSLLETRGDDGRRTLWVGTGSGLARLTDVGEWCIYNTTSGGVAGEGAGALPNNSVWGLLETVGEDGGRTLWVGHERRRFPARFDRQQHPMDDALGRDDARPAQQHRLPNSRRCQEADLPVHQQRDRAPDA